MDIGKICNRNVVTVREADEAFALRINTLVRPSRSVRTGTDCDPGRQGAELQASDSVGGIASHRPLEIIGPESKRRVCR